MKRVFVIVLDSFGIGALPDAHLFGDSGANTLKSVSNSKYFKADNLKKLGLFNIDGVSVGSKYEKPIAKHGRLVELSNGKDTTTGHWEMAGIVSKKPSPVFEKGLPSNVIKKLEEAFNRPILCNKAYSGTEVIRDYGEQHIKTGALICYTSADSVFQIAAHEDVVPIDELYSCCEKARKILVGDYAVSRVIARPFITENGEFKRTANRHDFSLKPTGKTVLDVLCQNGFDTIAVGKITDIFAGVGISRTIRTISNADGMQKTLQLTNEDFNGLCFVNLVDFDTLYGHRNDADGYAKAIAEFDAFLPKLLEKLNSDDALIITADHGCDPCDNSTDHTREYVPVLIYSDSVEPCNFGTKNSFACIGKTVANMLGCDIVEGEIL